jgi:hypothetical protein
VTPFTLTFALGKGECIRRKTAWTNTRFLGALKRVQHQSISAGNPQASKTRQYWETDPSEFAITASKL